MSYNVGLARMKKYEGKFKIAKLSIGEKAPPWFIFHLSSFKLCYERSTLHLAIEDRAMKKKDNGSALSGGYTRQT